MSFRVRFGERVVAGGLRPSGKDAVIGYRFHLYSRRGIEKSRESVDALKALVVRHFHMQGIELSHGGVLPGVRRIEETKRHSFGWEWEVRVG